MTKSTHRRMPGPEQKAAAGQMNPDSANVQEGWAYQHQKLVPMEITS